MDNENQLDLMTIAGYHCNDSERINKYVTTNELIIDRRDTHWLGEGMYFWDNLANGNYWLRQKKRKYPSKEFKIAKSIISYLENSMLDLTDVDICNSIERLFITYKKKLGDLGVDYPLGKKLNLLRELDSFTYSIVKVHGSYEKISSDLIDYKPYNPNYPRPTNSVRTIYAVSDNELIKKSSII